MKNPFAFLASVLSPERKSLAAPEADLQALFGAAVPTAAGVSVGPGSALTVPAVNCAVRAISEAVATLDVKVMRRDGATEEEATDHPVAGLLRDRVNDWTPSFEFIRDIVASALIYDNGGLAWINRVSGRPVELIAYDNSHLTAQRHEDGTGAYRYFLNGREIPASDIVHLRSPFGRSPLSLARESVGLALTLDAHAARLFGNGARPSGVLALKGRATPEAVRRIRESWNLAHGGGKSGGTAIVDEDASYTALTFSSVDSQFQEMRTFEVLQIARAFRVPPQMLFDLDRATWSNSEQMGREFLTYTLEPWLRSLEGCLRQALFSPEEYPSHLVHFERDDLTRADIGARATAYSSLIAARVVNPNEVREWEGLPSYEGGNEFANPHTSTTASAGAAAPQDGGA
jgi:HK97 family phage portal protein